MAVVISDGALGSARTGLVTLLAGLERSPVTRPWARRVRAKLPAPLSAVLNAQPEGIGLDPAGGAALFETEAGPIVVLPVADRAKLVAAMRGTVAGGVDRFEGDMSCKPVASRYVCATRAEQLDKLADGAPYSPIDGWDAALRGDIEFYFSEVPAPVAGFLRVAGLVGSVGVRIGARVEPGGATIRTHMTGKSTGALALAQSEERSRLLVDEEETPTGVFMVKAPAPLWQPVAQFALKELSAVRLPEGIALSEVVASIDGDVVGWSRPGGADRYVIRIGLADEKPMRALLAACEQLGGALPEGVALARRGVLCAVSLDLPRLLPGRSVTGKIEASIWIDEGALRIEVGDAGTRSAGGSSRSGFARDIAERPQIFATWGRGSLVGSNALAGLAAMVDGSHGETMQAVLYWLYRVNELGVSLRVQEDGVHAALRVRTVWANPAEVVAEIEKVIPGASAPEPAERVRMATLARRFPQSPFVRDERAGAGGLIIQSVPFIAAAAASAWVEERSRENTRLAMGDSPAALAARKRAVELARRHAELTRELIRGVIRASPSCAKMAAFVRRYHASRGSKTARLVQQLQQTPTVYRALMGQAHDQLVGPLIRDFFDATRLCDENVEFRAAMELVKAP